MLDRVGVFICVGVINYEFSQKGEKMTSVEEEGDGKSNPGPGDAFQSKDLPMNYVIQGESKNGYIGSGEAVNGELYEIFEIGESSDENEVEVNIEVESFVCCCY
ncbi:MAG: hypothetical protein EZS28_028060 [Streblomastix strix]|uniref:Uncharacterized protein n=1 Tax=Streblomastix strix TaxID=222440 RepID=A0A5J4V2V4_9EUKA|nr:MAG: hypothetical protein EZS28_028060 [Streblomastix strix]